MSLTLSFLLQIDKLVIDRYLLLSPVSTAVKPTSFLAKGIRLMADFHFMGKV